jgi:predicted kinase
MGRPLLEQICGAANDVSINWNGEIERIRDQTAVINSSSTMRQVFNFIMQFLPLSNAKIKELHSADDYLKAIHLSLKYMIEIISARDGRSCTAVSDDYSRRIDAALQMLTIRLGAYVTALDTLAQDSKRLTDNKCAREVLDKLKSLGLTFELCTQLYVLAMKRSSTECQEKNNEKVRAFAEVVIKENLLQKIEGAFPQLQLLALSVPIPPSSVAAPAFDMHAFWNEQQRSQPQAQPQQQPQPQDRQPQPQDQAMQFQTNGGRH